MNAPKTALAAVTKLIKRVVIVHRHIMRPRSGLLSGAACCVLILATGRINGQCNGGNPTGRFDGSATSGQAGKLDISLNLLCDHGVYKGTLYTPVGLYAVSSGSFQGNLLKLSLALNGSTISVEAILTNATLNGTFATSDDKGPLILHRTGDAIPPNPQTALTARQWHEDLTFFASQLTRRHPDAFANTPKPKFEAAVAELDARLDQLNPDAIYVGLDHLANLIGDGHTYVKFPADEANLPLDIERFGPDSRIVMVAPGYEEALGTRVIAIQDTPLAKAQELAATMTPVAETAGLRDLRVNSFLTIGMALHGLGITPVRNSARFLLASDDGRQFTVDFMALAPGEEPKWIHTASSLPIAEQPVAGSAACTLLHSADTLYCNVRMILNLKEPSRQMLDLINREHPDKVVIDLRQNGGGDYNLGLEYLIRPLMKNEKINRKGHLFVLIGPNTFSAAMSNAGQFRKMTNATLVGEPIGERPNSYQEPREFTLPNSRFIVRYSTRFYRFSDGKDNMVAPDKEITTSWSDYNAGYDTALEWILRRN
jgi:hypothetical protein